MSLKETIFSMMLEALELGEAVEVRHDRYMRSHGKKARDSGGGSSSWMFTHKPMGDVDVKNKEEVHTAQGKFSDAKKSAQQWGKQHGHSSVYVMEEVEQIDEGVKEKISGAIRREKQKEYPLLQNRRDVAANKAGSAYAAGDHKKGDRYMKWRDDNMKKEEVELDEETMPGNIALRMVDSHKNAAAYHKKNGNMKGYAAHLDISDRIEDAVKRAGRDMPIRSTQIEKASDKAFSNHPHRIVKNEEVELDEAEKPTYHYYATKNGIGAKEMKLTHAKSKPFTSETDALKHILKTGGRQDGIIHTVNSATGKIVQHRGIDGGQKAYPTPASDMASDAPKHVRDLKEEVQLDEISDEKKKDYIRAVADKGGILRKPRPASLKGFDRKKDDALVKAFKGGDMQDYANLHKKSEKRAGIALKALNSLKKEEVELDENTGGLFKNASEWENSAKDRGLVVKSATHPSGEMTKYQIAKDKQGNNRGHFDHGTKSGRLKEEVELDEAKTDMYHKHMLKALGKTRLPKDHNYTSAIANNGDFVVHNAGRVVGRIAKGEHDLK